MVDLVERGLGREPVLFVEALTARMHELAANDEFEAAAEARDRRATVAGVLRHHQLLTWLRTSGTLRFVTAHGVIELQDGRLAIADDPNQHPSAPTLERDQLDELLVVARWIRRELAAGRVRMLDATDPSMPPELAALAR